MKKTILLLLSSAFVVLQAKTINFYFYGADKQGVYNSTTTNEDIKREFGDNFKINSIVLVESSSADNKMFKLQEKILDTSVEAFENYASLQVTSLTQSSQTSGYHTTKGTAKRLNQEKKDFKITILNSKGEVLRSFTKVIDKKTFIELLKSTKLAK